MGKLARQQFDVPRVFPQPARSRLVLSNPRLEEIIYSSVLGFNYGCGTIFRLRATGKLTTLRDFESSDGLVIADGLFQATNGILYGMIPEKGQIQWAGSREKKSRLRSRQNFFLDFPFYRTH